MRRLRLALFLLFAVGGAATAQEVAAPDRRAAPAEFFKGEPVYHSSAVTRRARITHKPEVDYTDAARDNGVVGTVYLRLVLGADGKVKDVKPLRSLPYGLTENTVRAARRIKFIPAQKDGREVAQFALVEYLFRLKPQELTKDAEITDRPNAEYTAEAKANKVEGKVVLEVELTADGKVVIIDVKQGLPHGLTESAVAAARGIRFVPARRGERAVGVLRDVEFVFKL